MKLNKTTKHEHCKVAIQYESGWDTYDIWQTLRPSKHFARLICVDQRCTEKSKWIKWLNKTEHAHLKKIDLTQITPYNKTHKRTV